METAEEIIKCLEKPTIESELLKPTLIRKLYKELGDPTEKDFPDEYKIAGGCWKKHSGYTKNISILTEAYMNSSNGYHTSWCIQKPSITKIEIVEEYSRAGWHCTVQAYNVMCTRYVKHPRYDNIWVEFYSSRDCNKYRYILEEK